MKHILPTICVLPLVFFCSLGCNKNEGTFISLQGINNNSTPNFYLSGESNGKPCLWINGTKNILSTSNGNAGQILSNGNDIYVAGYYELPSNNTNPGGFMPVQYVYWKNGTENKVGPVVYRNIPGEPTISIVNNNIYYTNSQAWENGTQLDLNLGNTGFIQMTTSLGDDIYFVGTDGSGKMAYWKNGIENDVIPNETTANAAYSLAVYSNNIYVGGADSMSMGTVWTNGVPAVLQTTTPGSYVSVVNSLFVNGTDMYAMGELMVPTYVTNGNYSSFYSKPAYWKNGVENDLPLNGDMYGNANSVYVSGSDIYVCGSTASGSVYWKNGILTKLGSDYGWVSSILIK
jgi:hypothetical protein